MTPSEWIEQLRQALGMRPRAAAWWGRRSSAERDVLVRAAGLPAWKAGLRWESLTAGEQLRIRQAVARWARWARRLEAELAELEEAAA